MPLSAAEKQRRYRERKKASEIYREKEKQRHKIYRQRIKRCDAVRAYDRERQRNLRKTERNRRLLQTKDNLENSFSSVQSRARCIRKVVRALPRSPNKQKLVVNLLAAKVGVKTMQCDPSDSNRREKKGLSHELRVSVEKFYLSDKISRVSPGMKDSRMFVIDGKRQRKQLRHLLMTIKEAHAIFCEENSEVKIGLTSFQKMRPPFIRYASEIPHNVCVCVIHENLRLKLSVLTDFLQDFEGPPRASDYVRLITCSRTSESCMIRTCKACSARELMASEEDEQQQISFYQWKKADGTRDTRIEKLKCEASVKDVCASVNENSKTLLWHIFIKDQQHSAFEKQRSGGEKMLQVDFSENYSFSQQNEIQSAHWNKKQITIFTAVFWFGDTVKSYAILSDDLDHCKFAVYAFLKTIIRDLKWSGLISSGDKVQIWSDGAASQFKNRYTLSTIEVFNKAFGIDVIWNFFASYHGKGAVDGIGGRMKQAAHSSIRRGKVINDLKSFADANTGGRITVKIIPSDLILRRKKEVEVRFQNVNCISGVQKFHHFSSVEDGCVVAKVYSDSDEHTGIKHRIINN